MATIQLQRRYSFTSSTVLEGPQVTPSASMRSPKTIALHPVETSCNLCEAPATPQELGLDRRPPKRDATQLPSPNSNDQRSLPTKITKLALEIDCDNDSGYSDDGDVILPSPPPPHPFHPLFYHHDERAHYFDNVLDFSLLSPASAPPTTTTPIAQLPPPPHFLSLPPEIRNQIYRELPDTLISSRPLIYCLSTFAGRKQHCLAAVCRQIRAESLALFYGYNTWVIKLEFKMMYDAFRSWIRDIGDENAGELRLLQLSVRGRAFRPCVGGGARAGGQAAPGAYPTGGGGALEYICVDGDASFRIDLSERVEGGEVEVLRCDGSALAAEAARLHLRGLVEPLWRKRREGRLRGADWLEMVDLFLGFTGWWI